jgi:RNA polymerase II subunit A small phosphatase-like protein
MQHKVYVNKRPGADEIMNRLADKYELVVYTASLSAYAKALMNVYDKEGRV